MKFTIDKTWKIGPLAVIAFLTFGLTLVNLYASLSNGGLAAERRLTTIETKLDGVQRSVERMENKLLYGASISGTTARN